MNQDSLKTINLIDCKRSTSVLEVLSLAAAALSLTEYCGDPSHHLCSLRRRMKRLDILFADDQDFCTDYGFRSPNKSSESYCIEKTPTPHFTSITGQELLVLDFKFNDERRILDVSFDHQEIIVPAKTAENVFDVPLMQGLKYQDFTEIKCLGEKNLKQFMNLLHKVLMHEHLVAPFLDPPFNPVEAKGDWHICLIQLPGVYKKSVFVFCPTTREKISLSLVDAEYLFLHLCVYKAQLNF